MGNKDKDLELLQHPTKQKFYRVTSVFMTFTVLGEMEWWGYKRPSKAMWILFRVNRLMVNVVPPSLLVSQIIYFYLHHKELGFNIKGIIFSIAPVNTMVIAIIISAKQACYKAAVKVFMAKIHLCNLVQTDFIKMKTIEMEKKTRFASYFMTTFLMLDWFSFCSCTAYNNYRNWEYIQNRTIRFQTMLYIMTPINFEYDLRNWVIVHSMNSYFICVACIIMAVKFTINYACVFQLIGHIEIFKHRLATEFKGDFSQEEIRKKLVDVIKYHTFILNIFEAIQSAFAFNVTIYYVYNLIADSLVLYLMMVAEKTDVLMYFCMISAYLGGLVVMSFVLEEIRRQCDDISDLVYDLPWADMSISNKKIFALFLMRAQPPLVFTSAGGLKAGVQPMLSIVKSTFSYYVMLKSSM